MNTQYIDHEVTLSSGQAKSIKDAIEKKGPVTIKISKENLTGDDKLALTKTQVNKITKAKKAKTGVELTFSKTQLKYMEKTGGFLQYLVKAIPFLLNALGGLASGTGNSSFNKQGVITDCFGINPRSVNGRTLSDTLSEYGLGGNTKGLRGAVWGNGLYLEREGSGLFLDRGKSCQC